MSDTNSPPPNILPSYSTFSPVFVEPKPPTNPPTSESTLPFLVLLFRPVPRADHLFDQHDDLEEDDGENRENDDGSKCQICFPVGSGGNDDISQSLIRSDEFPHYRPDHGQGNGDLQAAEKEGQGHGEANLDKGLQLARPVGTA